MPDVVASASFIARAVARSPVMSRSEREIARVLRRSTFAAASVRLLLLASSRDASRPVHKSAAAVLQSSLRKQRARHCVAAVRDFYTWQTVASRMADERYTSNCAADWLFYKPGRVLA